MKRGFPVREKELLSSSLSPSSPSSTHPRVSPSDEYARARARSHFQRVALPFRSTSRAHTRSHTQRRHTQTYKRTAGGGQAGRQAGRQTGEQASRTGWVGKKIIARHGRERRPRTSVRCSVRPYATSARMTSFSRRREKKDRAI